MTDMPDPAAFRDAGAAEPDALAFAAVPVVHRHHGWIAHRQRLFIHALAQTGCVSEACGAVRQARAGAVARPSSIDGPWPSS